MNNWDSYRRMSVNIDKAVVNDEVALLMLLHYKYLHSKYRDEDIFNDTYLKLTYNYNPELDFIDLFGYYYNLLKGAYYRDDKLINWLIVPIEDLDFAEEIEEEVDNVVIDRSLLYANLKQACKTKSKNNKLS